MAQRYDKIQIALILVGVGIGVAIPFLRSPSFPIVTWFFHWLETF